jgi:co-chaperonin GroES (HSP10)
MDLRAVVAEEFKNRNVEIEPLFPRVLVRVLPKEQTSRGGIVLPAGSGMSMQNKPTHEGVVLKTYKPFWNRYRRFEEWMITRSPEVLLNEDGKVKAIWQECSVQPGDHVLFPHMDFGITPVWPLDDGKGEFRLVEEGVIKGRVEYKETSTKDWLEEFLKEYDGATYPYAVNKLLEKVDVIRKDLVCKTMSGR